MNKTLTFDIAPLLKVATGSSEIYTFNGPVEFDNLKTKSDIEGKAEIMKIEDGFNFKVENVRITLEIECEKCLKPFEQEIEVEHGERQFFFEPPKIIEDPNNVFLVNKKNQTLNALEVLRQEIILHFPVISVCSKSCKGICPFCGINRNQKKCDCKEETAEYKPLSALKDLIK